ncbi:hypothetical protein [uncultured Clostridium sp.]|uniref:hypothetical protein n=1 Tax=uncultured Clostridium sp. TaxID=59620 RepID=UPI0025F14B6F|nr:hypothetical protein [uncultured Clostridium sp.]
MEAMEIMTKLANRDASKIKNIKQKQLIGFENDRVLFSLACSNMFLHGDEKSNLFFRSSLLNDETQHLVQNDKKKQKYYHLNLKLNINGLFHFSIFYV